MKDERVFIALERIALSLERLAPPAPEQPDFTKADAFLWDSSRHLVEAVTKVQRLPLHLFVGIDYIRDCLVENTRQFAAGYSANNVLLWGARGMGKSSLVKAAHGAILTEGLALKLIEIHREDIEKIAILMKILQKSKFRFLLFCDDLSFDQGENQYKSLKTLLEGGLEGRPENVLFYATSNRRHLLARDMIENESSSAIHPHEVLEEKISLSDRFGLWLGVHKSSQDEYLAMVEAYVLHFSLSYPKDQLHQEALEWATTRGSRTGRTAWQFIQYLAGRLQKRI